MSKDNITDINDNSNPVIDPDEYSAMETEAEKAKTQPESSVLTYTHKFKTPFCFNNKSYDELTFDWDSLDGQDCLDIEEELTARGITVVAPEFSSAYQIAYAARACTEKIGSDALALMPAKAFLKIKRQVRTFLLVAE